MAPAKLMTIEQIIRPKGPAAGGGSAEVVVSRAFTIEQIISPKAPQPAVVAAEATLAVDTAPAAVVMTDTAVTNMAASDPVTSDAVAAVVSAETAGDTPAN